jgi:hypothetical protein
MVKKFSVLALAGLIALPAVASAGAGKAPRDLENKIVELSRQLDSLKAELAKQNESLTSVGDKVGDLDAMLDEKSESWDLAARVKIYGDFRSRLDYMTAETMPQYSAGQIVSGFGMALPGMGFGSGPYSTSQIQTAVAGMKMYTPAQRAGLFASMGINPNPALTYSNDTLMTNRFRLNMRVKATEGVEFKGRLAMYKAWGMQSNPAGTGPFAMDGYIWDGNSTREPESNALRVDRAFLNWNGIAGLPMWFSVGRRPTTDGPPAHLRMGLDERLATPTNFMDYAFDGFTLGYAYNWANDLGSGRVRFCYGRGFEAGLGIENVPGSFGTQGLNDMDFAGINWDVLKKGDQLLNVQAFGAYNLVNTPAGVDFPNPLETAGVTSGNGILDRANLGNIYHTSFVYMDKAAALNYFFAGGWSHTDPQGYDELGNSLLGSWWSPLESEDGYSVFAGIRYDIDDLRLKLGLEYNYGSQYWVSMSPGHDDLYGSKLATRGHVGELYMVYDLPTGEAISKYAKTFMRLGYQYYKYDYTGSGSWLGAPADVDKLNSDPLNAQFFPALDDMNQIYLTFEAYF